MSTSLPLRLFKLDFDVVLHATKLSEDFGQLVDGSTLQSCNYCIVSFTWGPKPEGGWPPCNIGLHYKVNITSEEKLFFILRACARRGYEYVWMDTLCIDQSNKNEVAQEVPKMRYYYIKAHATIVFGDDYHNFSARWAKVEKCIHDWHLDPTGIILPNWHGLGHIKELLEDEWFHRAWTLQECLIPLRTTPFDSDITPDPPYNPARLITADGACLDIRSLSDLIIWCYFRLLEYPKGYGSAYPWIHPGEYNPITPPPTNPTSKPLGWWKTALLSYAVARDPAKMHPILGLQMLRAREVTRAQDRYTALEALNPTWKFEIDPTAWEASEAVKELDDASDDMAEQYIERKEAALLLSMVVGTKRGKRTWAAAAFTQKSLVEDIKIGSVFPGGGRWSLSTAKVQGDILHLRVADIIDVKVENFDAELDFFRSWMALHGAGHDCSKIHTVFSYAISKFKNYVNLKFKRGKPEFEIAALNTAQVPVPVYNNVIRTALREVFAASGMAANAYVG